MKMDKPEYRWQFLRRNEEYIEDCERWSGRKRNEWSKNEVIINFPMKYEKGKNLHAQYKNYRYINAGAFARLTYSPYRLEKYRNWYRDFPEHESLKEVVEDDKTGSWWDYYLKWEISLPVNPYMNGLPYFVDNGLRHVISDEFFIIRGDKPTEINLMASYPYSYKHSLLCVVNLNSPKKVLMKEFENLIDDYSKYRMLSNSVQLPEKRWRSRLKEYAEYLKVWVLRQKKKTYKQIAAIVYPDDQQYAGIDKARKSYKAAARLINGDYRKIK